MKNIYEKLRKQHSLPSFDNLNDDFEIETIEETSFLLREIRRKMTEKLQFFIKFLESTLQPETVMSDLHECKVFSDLEKEKMFSLYKKMMMFDRFSVETAINETEEKSGVFITEFYKEWSKMKEQLSEIMKKLKESWKNESISEDEVGYLG